jgi:hypothetical protein
MLQLLASSLGRLLQGADPLPQLGQQQHQHQHNLQLLLCPPRTTAVHTLLQRECCHAGADASHWQYQVRTFLLCLTVPRALWSAGAAALRRKHQL